MDGTATSPPIPTCGDGEIDDDEECDDGNAEPGDGCSAQCLHERVIFVTSVAYAGYAIGGLEGADVRCSMLAEKAGISNGEPFMAWLSTTAYQAFPAKRFPEEVRSAKGPFRLTDPERTVIASGWKDLTDGQLSYPINFTETGEFLLDERVWTDTTPAGAANSFGGDCGGWHEQVSQGGFGRTSSNSSGWTESAHTYCHMTARIYCIQISP